jgi:hypothetical protein
MNTYTLDRAAEPEAPLHDCPSCGLPAAITDRFTLGGAPSPVEHVKLVCVAGHWSTPPVEDLLGTELERQAAKRADRSTGNR